MSGMQYKLIPIDPTYVPDAARREAALLRLNAFTPSAHQVLAEVMEQVMFVSAMGNFERVECPDCGAEVDQRWWTDAMDATYTANRFADLGVTLPCCRAQVSLNDLTYHWPQGFARFILTAVEPDFADLSDAQLGELKGLLGCDLRTIWVHL
jgi:hypothetical protein